jgi:probable F420-dependent oxidoreductase
MKFTLSIAFCDALHYVPLARAADQAGWHSVSVLDGLFFYETAEYLYPVAETGAPYWTGSTPYLDPFTAIAAMAAVTERVQLYTNVLKLPVRHPLLVAKSATSVAALSNGRFALGVGLSSWPQDYAVLGENWKDRGPRSAEMVEIIRGISRGGSFEFQGRFYQIPRMEIAPAPAKPIPIYFGGNADAVLRRAAFHGDGYIGTQNAVNTIDELPALLGRLRGYLAEAGKPESAFEIKYVPESVGIDALKLLADLGITDVVLWPWLYYPGDANDLNFKLDCIRRFRDEIFPLFDSGDKHLQANA